MSDKFGRKVLVVGGGRWQAPLIGKLHSYFEVVDAVDPYLDSAGLNLVDNHIMLDIKDVDRIHDQIKDNRYDLIISDQSDLGIETATLLSNRLGLPGNQVDQVELFLKKHKSRDFAKSLGIKVPDYVYSSESEELFQFYLGKNYKVIVKPSDSQASRGVSLVDAGDLEKFKEAIIEAKEYSRNNVVMVEEFIHGTELTAEGIVIDGKHNTLAVSEKEHFRTGIASRLKYPAKLTADTMSKLIEVNDRYVNHSGIRSAITHAEYIYNRNTEDMVLVEIACRGGGSLISSSIIPWMSGVDVYDALIRNLMGVPVKEIERKHNTHQALLQFFEFSSGRVEDINGLSDITQLKGVDELMVFVKTGEYIHPAGDDSKRHAMVVILADDEGHLNQTFSLVTDRLRVRVTKN